MSIRTFFPETRFPMREHSPSAYTALAQMLAAMVAAPIMALTRLEVELLPSGVGDPRPYAPPCKPGPVRPHIPERLRFLEALGPTDILAGRKMGGHEYLAFVFPRLVVAECPRFGNAAYLFRRDADWLGLIQHDKGELRRSKPQGFLRRLNHVGAWQRRLTATIAAGA